MSEERDNMLYEAGWKAGSTKVDRMIEVVNCRHEQAHLRFKSIHPQAEFLGEAMALREILFELEDIR